MQHESLVPGRGATALDATAGLPKFGHPDPSQWTAITEPLLIHYWRVVEKHKWIVVATLVVVFTCTAILTFRTTPIYEAAGKIAINHEQNDPLGLKPSASSESEDWDYTVTVDTQVKILQSDALALQVIKKLNLYGRPPYGTSLSGPQDPLLNNQVTPAREMAMLSAFHGGLNVRAIPGTRIVEVHFSSPDPKLAAEVPNVVINTFIEQNFQTRFDATTQTSDWLSKQLADLQIKVESSQERMVKYQKETGILGLDEKQNIITSKLDQLNHDLTQAQTDRIRSEANYKLVAGGGSLNTPDPLLDHLRQRQAELRTQLAQLTTEFGPSYPKVMELNSQLAQVNAAVQAEHTKQASLVRDEFLATAQRERMLGSALEAQKQEANRLNEKAVEFNLLKHDYESNRQLYDGLLQRLKEAGVAAGLRSNNIRVIDIARVPVTPAKPHIPTNLAMGFIAGLALGIGLAFVVEGADNTVRSGEDVQEISGLPSLGAIPFSRSLVPVQAKRLSLNAAARAGSIELAPHLRPRSNVAEAYRALRTSLLLSSSSQPPTVISITSPLPREGKTVTAINSAVVMAQNSRRVLLIDADMRCPSIHVRLKLPADIGLSTVLTGNCTSEQAIVPYGSVENLYILPAGPLPPYPAELLSSVMMRSLLQKLRTEYDHIILDTPPLLVVTDAAMLARESDAILLVVRAGMTKKRALQRCREILAIIGVKATGVVVNAFSEASAGTYYGSSYGHYSSYYGNDSESERVNQK